MLAIHHAAAFLLMVTTGCAGTVAVTRTFAPDAAADAQNDNFVPVAVVRGAGRIPLQPGARVVGDHVVLARTFTHKLEDGDVLEQDSIGRIVAVRSGSTPQVVTRFVPGTATSPDASDEVRGQLADDATAIVLRPTDGIEMHGEVGPDNAIPGGGRVQSSRWTSALVSGVILFAVSYTPTAYVGAGSPRSSDRVLEIPVAGPWMDLASRPACVPPPSRVQLPIDPCIEETASRVAIVASGALQGLATVLTLVGLPSHSEIIEGGSAARGTGRLHARRAATFAIVPTGSGAAAVGTF